MSNFLAVATVSEVLRSILDEGTTDAVPEVQVNVSILRPDEVDDGDGQGHVSLFLYQVMPHPSLRNQAMPTRSSGGALVRTPQTALTLRYLLTFAGDSSRQVAERLLGAAVAELEARPVLDRDLIRRVIQTQQVSKPFLAQSDLVEEVDLVKLTPLALELEELSKLWSVFFQVPYALSVAYEASVVLLEPRRAAPQTALPVHGPVPGPEPGEVHDGRTLFVDPFRRPLIEAVVPAAGAGEPLVAGSTVTLRGRQLRGEVTHVTVGGRRLAPPPADPGDTEIEVPLTAPPVPEESLRAGVVGVQVVHERLRGEPPVAVRDVESNVAPFVLRPRITAVATDNVEDDDDNTHSADIELTLEPPVGKRQRVVLVLNELMVSSPPAPPPDRPPRAYSFEAPSRDVEGEPESTAQLTIAVSRVRPDDYLVRVQVDGAESLPTLGSLPQTPNVQQYVEPRITLP
ncbi:MAG: DUF4255 domain-containing protein [Acidobacteriota bacterium]|nr:DUF4255 domain-containing protein [Acidobacteriota bacterium]